MIVLMTLAAFVVLATTVALLDWRRGWILAVLLGVMQDPARKITPGTPVYVTFSIVVIYVAVIVASHVQMQREAREFSQRFAKIASAFVIFLVFLMLAAVNGLMTFGIEFWKVPLLSFCVYLVPLPAVLLGYMYLNREELLYDFFRFYSVITAVALIGTPLEYLRVESKLLGMVAQSGDFIRHLPGLQIRLISGFYRGPDIMGWHAATLTCIAVAMILRAGLRTRAWPWMLTAAWGFFNCMISGRRKAIYYVAVFVAVLMWRYYQRLKAAQFMAILLTGLALAFIVHKISANEKSSVYAAGAVTSRQELAQRLEGGVVETIRQFGILGAGLGTATQGVYHLTGKESNIGWQEGGLGKLTIELGVPGLIAAALLMATMFRTMLRITRVPDLPDSTQITRVVLFALVTANGANFIASAQAYSDPLLALTSAFFVGCLFATATLDERAAAARVAAPSVRNLSPATA